MKNKRTFPIMSTILVLLFLSGTIFTQTTAFNYQGSLNTSGSPATGNYDFEFALFDSLAAGTQLGSTLTRSAVAVANGTFAVSLDFGSQFPGANRFLEVRVRLSGQPGITTLAPRQQVNSAPYSVKTLTADIATNATNATTSVTANTAINATNAGTANNALQLGGVTASQYVVTTDPRMTDPRTPTAGSANYVQNTTSPQATSNFNVSGNGTAGGTLRGDVVRAETGFNIGLFRVFSIAGGNNTFVGRDNGNDNTTGTNNSFFGQSSGTRNSTGSSNTFVGSIAGFNNLIGTRNTFIGSSAGTVNTEGSNNTAIGAFSTFSSSSLNFATAVGAGAVADGSNRIVLGRSGGEDRVVVPGNFQSAFMTTGLINRVRMSADSFFNLFVRGSENSDGLSPGTGQTIVGVDAGNNTSTGNNNSFFGYRAGSAVTSGSDNSVFGRSAGLSITLGSRNAFFGSNTGEFTTGSDNAFFGHGTGSAIGGGNNTAIGSNARTSSTSFSTAIGSGSSASLSNSIYLGRPDGEDTVRIPGTLSITGGTDAEPGFGGYMVAGATSSTNVVIDDNEIMARNAGGLATLAINADGGNVNLIQGGNGFVGIGTPTPADKLDVKGDIRVGTSGTNGCLKNNNGGAITGTCSSDTRFKRDVTAFPSVLKDFVELRPVNYFWRTDEFPEKRFGPDQTYGLLAQEVENVMPSLVSTDADGFKQIDYGKLPMLTIQAVKELNEQNERLKVEISNQQSAISSQQNQIEGQRKLIETQQAAIDELKLIVCSLKPDAKGCSPR